MDANPTNGNEGDAWPSDASWQQVQARLVDVPGEEGIELRRAGYRPYFLMLAEGVRIEPGCHFSHPERIALDRDARINRGALVFGSGGVRIGRHARIGPRLFLHSANHDVSEGAPEAFFERGYAPARVEIGDNVLLSADVRVLPGCRLGDGSFVAAGATLSGKTYQAGSRLAGCPAREMKPGQMLAPSHSGATGDDLLVLVPADDPARKALWEHVLGSLGLPQAVVGHVDERPHVHAKSLLLDRGVDMASVGTCAERCWSVREGDSPMEAADDGTCTVILTDGGSASLPTEARVRLRPRIRDGASPAECARFTALWLCDRLVKRVEPLSAAELADWLVTLQVARRTPGAVERLPDHVVSAVVRRWPSELADLRPGPGAADPQAQEALTNAVMDRIAADGLSGAERDRLGGLRKRCLQVPALLVHRAMLADPRAVELLAEVAPHCNTGHRLAALEIATAIAGGAGNATGQAGLPLHDAAWQSEVPALPRATPSSPRPLLSPLVVALWLVRAGMDLQGLCVGTGLFDEPEEVRQLQWRPTGRSSPGGAAGLASESNRTISASLLDAWAALHSGSLREGHQAFLSQDSYRDTVRLVERVLLDALGAVFRTAGIPMVRLSPWPAPHRSALAIRFDVDRPVTAAQVRRIVAAQARSLNSPCGSWYVFPDDPRRAELTRLLDAWLQEVGLHLRSENDAEPGSGVTMHSGPEARYWAGASTLGPIAERGAPYGEFLSASFDVPRPALGLGGSCRIMTTPLHFPLEGGTADESLEYFDRLRDRFRERLAHGGLAVVGSHPDVAAPLLEQLFAREDLSGAWCTTVGRAIQRSESILAHGRIRARTVPGAVELRSAGHVADLSMAVRMPDGTTKECTTQLQAGVPRTVAFDEAATVQFQ